MYLSLSVIFKGSVLSFGDFVEMLRMVHCEPMHHLDPNLKVLFHQTLTWFQSLLKVLTVKYAATGTRHFISADGNIQYMVIINPNFLHGSFIMVSVDLYGKKSVSTKILANGSVQICPQLPISK